MGADIYLESVLATKTGLSYDEKYTPDCYFRDSYNVTSLYWLLGLSWWNDVDKVSPGKEFRDADGDLTPEGIEKAVDLQRKYLEEFKKIAETFESKFAEWPGERAGQARIDDGDGDNSRAAWEEMVALGEPLRWSV